MATSPLILKLGGSLLASGDMPSCIALAVQSTRRIVVVPGGGKFADDVHLAQMRDGFTDAVAHKLAILAMHDMAAVLQDMHSELKPAHSLDQIDEVWQSGHVPLWLAWPMASKATDLPQNWSVTSDGLAAWLACRIAGAEVALVKSCPVPTDATLADMVAAGIADPTFAHLVKENAILWHVIKASNTAKLTALLTGSKP